MSSILNKTRSKILTGLASLLIAGCGNNPTSVPTNPPVENKAPTIEITHNNINQETNSASFVFKSQDIDGTIDKYNVLCTPSFTQPETIPSRSGGSTDVQEYANFFNPGNHVFQVWAFDDDGAKSNVASFYFTMNPDDPLDNIPPNTRITSGPSGTIDRSTVEFRWTGSDNITSAPNLVYQTWLVGHDAGWSLRTNATNKSYSGLEEKLYEFRVRSFDEAGNVDGSPASRTFTVDTSSEPEFLDILQSYALSDIQAGRDLACDDNYLWFVGGTSLEKRLKSDPNVLLGRYSLASLDNPHSLGFTGIAVTEEGDILVHSQDSDHFYVLDRNNPNDVKEDLVAESNYVKNMRGLKAVGNILHGVTGQGHLVRATINDMRLYDVDLESSNSEYSRVSIGHDGTSRCVIAYNKNEVNSGNYVSYFFKVDGNGNLVGEGVKFDYDTPGSFLDDPAFIDFGDSFVWTGANVNGVPTLYKHQK